MAGFSVNKDYLAKMMAQVNSQLQKNKAVAQTMAEASYDKWKQTPEYKSRQESAKMLLKEIQHLESGYKKYSERALGIWLIYHGERTLGSGGFGDFRHTVFSLEKVLSRISFPRKLDGTEVEYMGQDGRGSPVPVATNSGIGGGTYADLSAGQQFFLGSSFRIASESGDIPRISMEHMMRSLESMFGSRDVILRYHGALRNGTINTRLNSGNIRDHMLGELTPMTTSIGTKNAKDLFQRKGGVMPSRGSIDRVKREDLERLAEKLGGTRGRKPNDTEVIIPLEIDLLKDFETYSDPIAQFMSRFEAKIDTMRWQTYTESVAKANFKSSSEQRMADFSSYADFNRFLLGEYGAPLSHGGAESYVGHMSGSMDTSAFYSSTYSELSYYRLSEYYHTTKSLVAGVYSSALYARATY